MLSLNPLSHDEKETDYLDRMDDLGVTLETVISFARRRIRALDIAGAEFLGNREIDKAITWWESTLESALTRLEMRSIR